MRWHRSSGDTQPAMPKRQHAALGAMLAGVLAVLLVAWVLIDDNEPSGTTTTEAEIVSAAALRTGVAMHESPVYWAGTTAGTELELSRPSADRTYVRYLPESAKAGDPRPFLTVGSYSFEDPTGTLRSRGEQPGGVVISAPGGGVAYFDRKDPKSVYLAYPGTEVEIEVFSPEFKEALQLVTEGRIVPVE
jgi:hypothetical protein